MKPKLIEIRTDDYGMFSNTQDILKCIDRRIKSIKKREEETLKEDHYESKAFAILHYNLVVGELEHLKNQINRGSYIIDEEEL